MYNSLMMNYLTVILVWCYYAFYVYSQYTDSIKTTKWFTVIAIGYGIFGNLMWSILSKKMNQAQTLQFAMLWDSGTHLLCFILPFLIFGDKIKIHTIIGMSMIFIGVSIILFWESIVNK